MEVLNDSQKEAVQCTAKYLQIIAGPGTGKTTVLAHRILKLLEDGIDPTSIVAFTYTNRARSVLLDRLHMLLGPEKIHVADGLSISTYHGYCGQLVAAYPEDTGISSEWSLIDEFDREQILNDPTLDIPRISRSRFPVGSPKTAVMAYEQRLRECKCYDYSQLLQFGSRITHSRDLGITHLLIDEFQDGESELWNMIHGLQRQHHDLHLTVVGDPNQEIFAFRPSHIRRAFETMESKLRILPGELETIRLQINYRSTPEIVRACNSIVPFEPGLRAADTRSHGDVPVLRIYDTPAAEIAGVGEYIKELLLQQQRPEKIAVIVRSNRNAAEFTRELRAKGIPVMDLLDRNKVLKGNLVYTLFKMATSPNDVLLGNLLLNPWNPVVKPSDLVMRSSNGDLASDLASKAYGSLRPRRCKELVLHLLPLCLDIFRSSLSASVVRNTVLRLLDGWATPEKTAKLIENEVNNPGEYTLRRRVPERFLHLLTCAQRFAGRDDFIDPHKPFVPQVCGLFADSSTMIATSPGVHVMTIHAAKGREFPIVLLPQGEVNNWMAAQDSVDDERRLLYVGASRAQQKLFLSHSGPISQSRNRFLSTEHQNTSVDSLQLIKKKYFRILGPVPVRMIAAFKAHHL